jgi:uncharacterized protein
VRRLEQADLIIHGGDFVAASVLEALRELGPVEAVHGNMDKAALRALLPAELVIEAGGARIGLVHNGGPRAGREARLAARFPSCSAVVYGHSHIPQVSRHENVLILNPGSPTDRRRAPEHTMLELEIEGGELRPQLITL